MRYWNGACFVPRNQIYRTQQSCTETLITFWENWLGTWWAQKVQASIVCSMYVLYCVKHVCIAVRHVTSLCWGTETLQTCKHNIIWHQKRWWVIRKQLLSRKVGNECSLIRPRSTIGVLQSKIAHSMDNEKTDPGKGTQPHSHANKDSGVKFKSGPYYNSILNS